MKQNRAAMRAKTIGPGQSFPLGASIYPGGVNFSLYSKNGTLVELLMFDHVDDENPARVSQVPGSLRVTARPPSTRPTSGM